MNSSVCVPIVDATQVGEARRLIGALAVELGLSETIRGQLAIIVAELGNNLAKHTQGKGGSLVFRALPESSGIEILSLDQGPGMVDIARCMSDGYSTAGSPGTGLGAVYRLSAVFDLYSRPGAGTAIVAQVFAKPRTQGVSERPLTGQLEVGALCVPIQGEQVSGDGWQARLSDHSASVLMADGLGHGPLAHAAAQDAIRCFMEHPELSSPAALQSIHLALRSTRGAAVAITRIDAEQSLVMHVGVGNISGLVFSRSGELRRMVSHNGTAGVNVRKIQEFSYPWTSGSVMVMHSDGISTHWDLQRYPGLVTRHPAVIAGVIYRDFTRGRDDASIVVTANWERSVSPTWSATA